MGDATTDLVGFASGVFIDLFEVFAQDTRVKFLLPGGKTFALVLAVLFDTAISAVWVNTEGITDTSDTDANT